VTAGLEFLKNKWTSDIEAQYVFEQTKTAENENPTERYILTNLGTTYTLIKEGSKFELFFRLRNIFDVEARNHVSTLKDIAPMPGRNFILGGQILI
jgi:iron complex outermembrane receptor protein